ncbi:MAG: PQQ-binding-like beta-propeller repeat protein [Pirellulales bacterium]
MGSSVHFQWNFDLVVRLALATGALSFGASTQAAEAWPQFRGPDGQGHATSERAPVSWSEENGIAWKTAVRGRGWSSPVVLGQQVWMTTAETQIGTEEERKRVAIDPKATNQPLFVVSSVSLRAVCVDRATGEITQDVELFDVQRPEPVQQTNSYASPTPVMEAGRLYCHFGTFGTACLDTNSGSIVWKRRFPIKHFVGPGSSPVLVEGLLVLTCDGTDQQYIVAVDKRTGAVAWKVERPPIRSTRPNFRKSFSTPLVISVAGQRQIVIPGAQWIVAYDPVSGKEIWRFDHGGGFSLVPRPLFDGSRLFFCTGYLQPRLVALQVAAGEDPSHVDVVWEESKQIPTVPSPIVVGDRVYVISNRGIAMCLDAATGSVTWKQRIAGNYTASLLSAGGDIYAFNLEGVTTVFQPGDKFRRIARNQLDGQIRATPAVVDGAMFLRTDTHLYRIE